MVDTQPEVWLRGPVDGVPALLQPVAHALLQAREEVRELMRGFPEALLWDRPAGVASVGFHLQHIAGVLDRLFTYARGRSLSAEQLKALMAEGSSEDSSVDVSELVARFDSQVESAIEQLRHTDAATLTDAREVGRRKLPSTVLGLMAHAAEHVQRHVGQMIVTVRVQRQDALDG